MLVVEHHLSQTYKPSPELPAVKMYSELLETKFNDYEQSLKELEQLIDSYESLFKEIQGSFLKTELKAVKRYEFEQKVLEIRNRLKYPE